jgi:hypothetical protein
MSGFIKQVDEKTKLAGANKLEALTFSLGVNPVTKREETFGVDDYVSKFEPTRLAKIIRERLSK